MKSVPEGAATSCYVATAPALAPDQPSVVLDRLQDAGSTKPVTDESADGSAHGAQRAAELAACGRADLAKCRIHAGGTLLDLLTADQLGFDPRFLGGHGYFLGGVRV